MYKGRSLQGIQYVAPPTSHHSTTNRGVFCDKASESGHMTIREPTLKRRRRERKYYKSWYLIAVLNTKARKMHA